MSDFDKIERRLHHLLRIMRRARETGREAELLEKLPAVLGLLAEQAQAAHEAIAVERWEAVSLGREP